MVNFDLKQIDVKSKVRDLVSLTPLVFLCVGFASFILFGLFEGAYYFSMSSQVIKQPWLSGIFCIAFPTILEVGQFAFMMATIWNLINSTKNANMPQQKWFSFDTAKLYSLIGLLATALIVYFKLSELNNMVDFWKSGDFAPYIKSALQFLIILGIVLEIRIIMILNDRN